MRATHVVGVLDDVEPGDGGSTFGGSREGGEDADGGGLAGAVVAEEAEDGAGGDVEVEVPQGPEIVEALADPLGLDRMAY